MISRKGNVEVEFEGIKMGFRVNTWAFKEIQKACGAKSITEVLGKIGFVDGNIDCELYLVFLLEAAKEYRYQEKIEGELTLRDISEWVDAMGGLAPSLGIISEGLNQYTPKNSTAPETGQIIDP